MAAVGVRYFVVALLLCCCRVVVVYLSPPGGTGFCPLSIRTSASTRSENRPRPALFCLSRRFERRQRWVLTEFASQGGLVFACVVENRENDTIFDEGSR